MSSVSSSPGGDRTGPTARAVECFSLARPAEETRERYVRMARDRVRRLGVDEIGLVAEGAVQSAWVVLTERIETGRIRPILSRTESDQVFTVLLLHVLSDERRRQHSCKRDPAKFSLSALEEAGFDAIDENASSPEQRATGEEPLRRLLHFLDHADDSLQEVALLKQEGYTNEEIAAKRDQPVWHVERTLERIRAILWPHRDDRE